MPETDIDNADYGDFKNTITDWSVTAQSTEGPEDQKETTYDNVNWTTYLGYYKTVPELASAIDAKATWTIGKGFMADEITTMQLSAITGWGKDSFNTILENAVRTYHVGGDSFCEIIRDPEDPNRIINLKPLDPGNIRIIANRKGLILRYEQLNRIAGTKNKRWKPEDMFHLARNRVADEIHGVSIIPAVEEIIKMRQEAMADYRKLLHRNVFPVRIWYLDTDKAAEIATFKAKADKAYTQGENIYIPKGTVETEIAATPSNSTLNPLPWIQQLNQYFFQATGVPQIIVGGAQEITEASAKIAYLAFEQVIEEEQLFVEEQVLAQLNLEIDLEFPASLQNELLSDNRKAETMQASTPEDTSVNPDQTGLAPAGEVLQ
tara:strand:+ start:43 stop:1173 length:1131 start_codon:yes stop_codon:yes gene_type:complete